MSNSGYYVTKNFVVYTSHIVFLDVKSVSLRWPGDVTRMREVMNEYRILMWKLLR
jgi:hypothetical protein